MRFLARSFSAIAILALSTLAAHADTFSYSFIDTTDSVINPNYFTYISSTLITTTTTINPATCQIDSFACTNVVFTFNPADPSGPAHLEINGPKVGDGYYFNSVSALTTIGTTVTFNGHVTLTIMDVPSPAVVPEPSSLALLGSGLVGLAGAMRRKLFQS